MTRERTSKLLHNVLELLRTEVTKRYADSKDADSYVFSRLDITTSEIEEIYKNDPEELKLIYGETLIDDSFEVNKEEKQKMLNDLFNEIQELDDYDDDTIELCYLSVCIDKTRGVTVDITINADMKYKMTWESCGLDSEEICDTIQDVIEQLDDTAWDASDWTY